MFQLFLKVQNKKYLKLYQITSVIIWFWFGMFGKIIPIFGNHQAIIEQIVSIENGFSLMKLLGLFEIIFALLILKFPHSKLLFWLQIVLILGMNFSEFLLADDLLLFGELNLLLACVYIATISTFFIHSKTNTYAFL